MATSHPAVSEATRRPRWLVEAQARRSGGNGDTNIPPGPGTWSYLRVTLICAVVGGLLWLSVAELQAESDPYLFWLDLTLGLISLVMLRWRTRWPFALAMAMLPMSAFSLSSSAAVGAMMITVAIGRRIPQILLVGSTHALAGLVFNEIEPGQNLPWWGNLAFSVVLISGLMAWGMFIGARRELMITLQDRALRAEEEQALRVAQAKGQERERIAREMHDVLAHRISLVCMHAGALTYRTDATPEEVTHSAEIIARNAHLALEDLREVIGVLRQGEVDGGPERPQPSLQDLPELVSEARGADMNVRLSSSVTDLGTAPDSLGRGAYRIVQEGLTNARKHAPNTRVDVILTGGPGKDLTVEIRNRRPLGTRASTIPGTGTGLLGLTERVELAGGQLTHGPTTDGDFVVRATLPWPA